MSREEMMQSELEYWRTFPEFYPEELARRTNLHLDEVIIDELIRLNFDGLRILDVGSGPISWFGNKSCTGAFEMTLCDPLGGEFPKLAEAWGRSDLPTVVTCRGEDLVDQFGRESFDVVCANNSVDHAEDAVACLTNMAAVCKPGGIVYLSHYYCTGVRCQWSGLHHWNFYVSFGKLWIHSKADAWYDVQEVLGMAQDRVWVKDTENTEVLGLYRKG